MMVGSVKSDCYVYSCELRMSPASIYNCNVCLTPFACQPHKVMSNEALSLQQCTHLQPSEMLSITGIVHTKNERKNRSRRKEVRGAGEGVGVVD